MSDSQAHHQRTRTSTWHRDCHSGSRPLQVLISRGGAVRQRQLPAALDEAVASFLGAEDREYFWPAPLLPLSLADAVRMNFQYPVSPSFGEQYCVETPDVGVSNSLGPTNRICRVRLVQPGDRNLDTALVGLRFLGALLGVAEKCGLPGACAPAPSSVCPRVCRSV